MVVKFSKIIIFFRNSVIRTHHQPSSKRLCLIRLARNRKSQHKISRELTTDHQRQLKDLQEERQIVIGSLEARDTKNAQEIQTLHKKCRCLTNL